MRVRYLIVTVCVLIGLGLIAALVVALSTIPRGTSYLAFTQGRSETYYSNLARACDQLILTLQPGSTPVRIRGDDPRLPPLLQEMRATQVEVSKSRVWLVMEVQRYGLAWEEDDYETNTWKLAAGGEAGPIPLYSRKKEDRQR
jgi:hypothetical protein